MPTFSKLKEGNKIVLKGRRVSSYVEDSSELGLSKNEKDFNLMYGEVYKVNYDAKNKWRNLVHWFRLIIFYDFFITLADHVLIFQRFCERGRLKTTK